MKSITHDEIHTSSFLVSFLLMLVKLSLENFFDSQMKLGMQISLLGSSKDDQTKNQVLKSAPNTEKASLSKLDIDLRLPNRPSPIYIVIWSKINSNHYFFKSKKEEAV